MYGFVYYGLVLRARCLLLHTLHGLGIVGSHGPGVGLFFFFHAELRRLLANAE